MNRGDSYHMFIDGEWIDSASGESIEVHDPSTGKVLEKVPSASVDDVHRAINAA